MKQKILIIDDDVDLCRLLRHHLEQEGYDVCTCHDGVMGLHELQSAEYQLVVLDIMLPMINGYEVLERIRKKSFIPVLILTAKDSEGDKVSGLRMGADDYLTKPFANSEFLARVSSLLRRYTIFNTADGSPEIITVGGMSIDKAGREVRKDGMLLELTAKEFDLLLHFAENPGKVFTKRQIYQAVWKDAYAYDDNNIMVHIRRLRKKIEDHPEHPKYILTVWGVGYKLGGETT
ncbi:response regulator transcription factor [Roseburia sp. 1XD42-69]|uniref:response regulator transcription factor n=1 Tax=Roseburia sp. 1XD42-69 TaxID=2320088 RepID=UPI000EA143BD|nr:response regulator transcription factor [Roseburia sp. 1XD42-69]MCX4320347.1 response regulator transcription factor [Lachnospiraceae bacterium]RKJ68222.1 DNA-binding response regulator [Roseburia sp. 1XD42-69]